MQQALDVVGKLVRTHGAQVAQPGRIARQLGRLQLVLQQAVVEVVQLQREEHQVGGDRRATLLHRLVRSEEHTSELQSLMRNSYAVFCLQKKKMLRRTTNRLRRY